MPLSPQQIEQIRKEAEEYVKSGDFINNIQCYIAGATAQAEDKFEFSEWCSHQDWKHSETNDIWYCSGQGEFITITPAELYAIYKQEKENG